MSNPEYVVVVPAYGRDYKTKKEVLADWLDHKDFKIEDMFHGYGRKVNIDDKPANWILEVRYDRLRKVMLIA